MKHYIEILEKFTDREYAEKFLKLVLIRSQDENVKSGLHKVNVVNKDTYPTIEKFLKALASHWNFISKETSDEIARILAGKNHESLFRSLMDELSEEYEEFILNKK